MICVIVFRGLSELYGLWNTYWISRRVSASRARAPAGSGCPAEEDLTLEVRVEPGDAAGERGLARARLAHQREALARSHRRARCRSSTCRVPYDAFTPRTATSASSTSISGRGVAVEPRGRRVPEHVGVTNAADLVIVGDGSSGGSAVVHLLLGI